MALAIQSAICGLQFVTCNSLFAADIDEFKVKRQEVFEFAEKPTVKREGDTVTITFASRGYCDATVAVEDADGLSPRIVRHLGSGVLGPNAPAPFQKSSLSQKIVWDCKTDQGKYLDNLDRYTVRVSLGLKPRFERTLLWDPKRRISYYPPILAAAAEGVYVCQSKGLDLVSLFDHAGNYVRTTYPFPASQLDKTQGLEWRTFPQDGRSCRSSRASARQRCSMAAATPTSTRPSAAASGR